MSLHFRCVRHGYQKARRSRINEIAAYVGRTRSMGTERQQAPPAGVIQRNSEQRGISAAVYICCWVMVPSAVEPLPGGSDIGRFSMFKTMRVSPASVSAKRHSAE